MVDINGAYTADVALECARAIEPFGIHWIEEPLPPGDLAAMPSCGRARPSRSPPARRTTRCATSVR